MGYEPVVFTKVSVSLKGGRKQSGRVNRSVLFQGTVERQSSLKQAGDYCIYMVAGSRLVLPCVT